VTHIACFPGEIASRFVVSTEFSRLRAVKAEAQSEPQGDSRHAYTDSDFTSKTADAKLITAFKRERGTIVDTVLQAKTVYLTGAMAFVCDSRDLVRCCHYCCLRIQGKTTFGKCDSKLQASAISKLQSTFPGISGCVLELSMRDMRCVRSRVASSEFGEASPDHDVSQQGPACQVGSGRQVDSEQEEAERAEGPKAAGQAQCQRRNGRRGR
jgi:hypothetical protein